MIRRRALLSLSLALGTLCVVGEPAHALEARLESPGFVVLVPDLPQVQWEPHPNAPKQPSARLFASSDGLTVSVLTPTADPGMTPAHCASWLAGNVLSRFLPDLGTVQIVRAGDNAYVLVFPFDVTPVRQLKAFVVSGNGKGHCIEMHLSRANPSDAERKQWLEGFRNVRVQIE